MVAVRRFFTTTGMSMGCRQIAVCVYRFDLILFKRLIVKKSSVKSDARAWLFCLYKTMN
jgi:hypothetical protein